MIKGSLRPHDGKETLAATSRRRHRPLYAGDVDASETSTPEDEGGPTATSKRLHDLRQPLSAILAAASALQIDPDLDPAMRDRLLRIVVDNAERLSEMLGDASASG